MVVGQFRRKRKPRGTAAETPLLMLILFAVFAFPLIDLISLALAYSTVWFVAFQSAAVASTQTDFKSSLSALVKKTSELNGSGFTNMLKMAPIAGYNASGTNLYIEAVDFMDASKSETIGPNKPVPPPVDLTNRFYEISAESSYEVKPFIDLGAVPLLSYIQGLGSPITFTAKVKRCAEFPQGLVHGPSGPGTTPASAAQPAPTTSFASPISVAGQTTEPWNRPKIYEEIESSGQKIVDHTVIQVPANNSGWTYSGINVAPGQQVWIDFRADGVWGDPNIFGAKDLTADGTLSGAINNPMTVGGYPMYYLAGSINPDRPNNIFGTGNQFQVGSNYYHYEPTEAGPLMLGHNFNNINFQKGAYESDATFEARMKSMYESFKGEMTVRIIVTQ